MRSGLVAPNPKRIPLFDVLRLFLALEVVSVHFNAYTSDHPMFLPEVVMAVPGFVALSGYLVLGSLESSGGYREFLRRRVLRIGPAFLASILLVLVLFGFGALLPLLGNYLMVVEGFFSINQPGGPNRPLWSLFTEEALYASMALVWLLGGYKKLWPTAALLAFSTWIAQASPAGDPLMVLKCVVASFLGGNLLYLLRERLPRNGWVCLAGAIAIGAARLHGPTPNAVSVLQTALCVLAARDLPQPRWKLPDLSYGLYIYHSPILVWMASVYTGQSYLDKSFLSSAPSAWMALGIVLAVLASILSWRFVESPALRLKSAVSKPRVRQPLGASLASFPSRLSPSEKPKDALPAI